VFRACSFVKARVASLNHGEFAAIEKLAVWLKDGPRMAAVSDVIAEDAAGEAEKFRTG
jgi:hypothetical protein